MSSGEPCAAMRYDVVVVGAGPAGAMAQRNAHVASSVSARWSRSESSTGLYPTGCVVLSVFPVLASFSSPRGSSRQDPFEARDGFGELVVLGRLAGKANASAGYGDRRDAPRFDPLAVILVEPSFRLFVRHRQRIAQ